MDYGLTLRQEPLTMQYSKHFLEKVIFQINFNVESLKESLNPEIIALCTAKTGAPIAESKTPLISVLPGQKVSSTVLPQWAFRGERFTIVVRHEFLQIIDRNYTNYGEYHPLIEEVFQIFRKIYKPIFSRVALRYINKIGFNEGATFDFENLINSSLVAPTLTYKDSGLSRSIGSMNMVDESGIQTNFTYGFVNPEFPNKIAKREFILDFDCYVILAQTIDSVIPVIFDLRNKVNSLFESSIMNGLREKMQ